MKRWFLSALSSLVVISALTACSSDSDQKAAPPSSPSQQPPVPKATPNPNDDSYPFDEEDLLPADESKENQMDQGNPKRSEGKQSDSEHQTKTKVNRSESQSGSQEKQSDSQEKQSGSQSGDSGSSTAPNKPSQQDDSANQASSSSLQAIEKEVIQLVNAEREKRGLKPLKASEKLSDLAQKKSDDMKKNSYFSHYSPTYGSPFDMLNQYGVSYRSAAENIAAGQMTAKEVMKSWMESSGHRANILNPSFTHIGVGFTKGGSMGTYWTQLFVQY
ncbi:CAP domain-containing protein [Thermoflavimicrobium dichotomicum]|uniref:Uncharacterized protein, YkwD family n=1 Tax=Thermoflavimicrobium dichotomicum TaxID=46223 RepID=A0A1I3TFB0_9BACL|nr:CAP domain-containing protein [Thermoflavimicrobium dichotomicum]SFJ69625.1 uncharacterized protein, YkwD family [Thermoflavimicrobium dichotomicum]